MENALPHPNPEPYLRIYFRFIFTLLSFHIRLTTSTTDQSLLAIPLY